MIAQEVLKTVQEADLREEIGDAERIIRDLGPVKGQLLEEVNLPEDEKAQRVYWLKLLADAYVTTENLREALEIYVAILYKIKEEFRADVLRSILSISDKTGVSVEFGVIAEPDKTGKKSLLSEILFFDLLGKLMKLEKRNFTLFSKISQRN